MVEKNLLQIIKIILLLTLFFSCEKKTRIVEIKLLILTPNNYYDFPVVLSGKIYDVGPGGLWFILEDKTGYIQVTTENITSSIQCIQKGNQISILGKLLQFKGHKYFSYSSMLRCGN
ncbi:hypothetical protein GCL60_01330 [Silvanigrella paludirubra]|uniref:Uncharacterized protein n=1 Tax=Silvanigrella paludirubra TaxID=2499159 RepID=A0A6N6VVI7_9BACT|nr:hypothetical protein [Silvanigrella paludirubra]KAB8040590.1 hypothetical protein GCL60_01330 [Silvanigrella paludirubra]